MGGGQGGEGGVEGAGEQEGQEGVVQEREVDCCPVGEEERGEFCEVP